MLANNLFLQPYSYGQGFEADLAGRRSDSSKLGSNSIGSLWSPLIDNINAITDTNAIILMTVP